jgi:hypothetical protein
MKLLRQLAVASITLLAMMQPSFAVKPSGSPEPSVSAVSSTGIMERGGTIEAVDVRNRNVIVDGVKYVLPAKPVVTHNASLRDLKNGSALRVGMKIRFNTSKHNYSAKEQVDEVWVVGSTKK